MLRRKPDWTYNGTLNFIEDHIVFPLTRKCSLLKNYITFYDISLKSGNNPHTNMRNKKEFLFFMNYQIWVIHNQARNRKRYEAYKYYSKTNQKDMR